MYEKYDFSFQNSPKCRSFARFVLHEVLFIFLFISELWDKKCFMLWRKQASIDYSSVMK